MVSYLAAFLLESRLVGLCKIKINRKIVSGNRRGGTGGNRKFRLKRYSDGGARPQACSTVLVGSAPCTERPTQQNIQGHGSHRRGLSRPQKVLFASFHPQRHFWWSHSQTPGLRPTPACRLPAGCTGSRPWANATSQMLLKPNYLPKGWPSEALT